MLTEKDDGKLTTVQISKRASRLLGELARVHKRSKSGQLEFIVEAEAEKLKLTPSAEAPVVATVEAA